MCAKITPEERLLLSIDNVTENYKTIGESAVGTLTLYLVSIRDDQIFLHITLPSSQSYPLPAYTSIKRVGNLEFLITANEYFTTDVTLQVLSLEDADTLEVIFKQFCSLPDLSEGSSLILVDNADGQEVASLSDFKITESSDLNYDKTPVEVVINQEKHEAIVRPAENPNDQPSQVILEFDPNDKILATGAGLSRFLIYTSNVVSSGMESTADWWVKNRPASEKPLVFKDTTKRNLQIASKYTGTGAYYTHKAVKTVSGAASSLGQRLMSSKKDPRDPNKGPGLFSRSLIAFSTVMDGIDTSTQTVIQGATSSSTRMIGHSYGKEAESLSADFGRSLKNCTMIYVDARGISRKAIVKGFGMGAIKGAFGKGDVVLKEKGSTPPKLPERPPQLPERPPSSSNASISGSSQSGQDSGAYPFEKH
ncbi:hypothetical protein D0Z00_003109 [Geotrichum galactomycetum]|uniref:Uncharacterized protein n=1 Tax=Geotrichum galactomycetum TaxID=27317 RepID=A0ACB6V284_9ASCO|nr:hypothetical protein D0Z00_003109 [Geotrichum candidum]